MHKIISDANGWIGTTLIQLKDQVIDNSGGSEVVCGGIVGYNEPPALSNRTVEISRQHALDRVSRPIFGGDGVSCSEHIQALHILGHKFGHVEQTQTCDDIPPHLEARCDARGLQLLREATGIYYHIAHSPAGISVTLSDADFEGRGRRF